MAALELVRLPHGCMAATEVVIKPMPLLSSPTSSCERSTETGRWRADFVVRLIHERHGDVRLSLKTLSARVGVTEQYLGRIFKEATGLSFRAYLRKVRTLEAQRLLADPVLSIKEIAIRLGYSEASNFVKDFKEMTGSRPLEYRLRTSHALITICLWFVESSM